VNKSYKVNNLGLSKEKRRRKKPKQPRLISPVRDRTCVNRIIYPY